MATIVNKSLSIVRFTVNILTHFFSCSINITRALVAALNTSQPLEPPVASQVLLRHKYVIPVLRAKLNPPTRAITTKRVRGHEEECVRETTAAGRVCWCRITNTKQRKRQQQQIVRKQCQSAKRICQKTRK